MRKPPSVLVSMLCWAAPVGTFFLVKPWYYGLLAAFGVFLLTGLRGIYWAIRDNRILENALERSARATQGAAEEEHRRMITKPVQAEELRELEKRQRAMRTEWERRLAGIYRAHQQR